MQHQNFFERKRSLSVEQPVLSDLLSSCQRFDKKSTMRILSIRNNTTPAQIIDEPDTLRVHPFRQHVYECKE